MRAARKKQLKEKLPPFWKRIARPETQRKLAVQELDAQLGKITERMDRRKKWSVFDTSLKDIEASLDFKITEHIRSVIRNFSEKKQFKVLDLGCGSGAALAQLKKMFRTRIKTVGLVRTRTPKQEYKGVDRLIDGNINEVKPRETFDFIYSRLGATDCTEMKITALKKAIEWLKLGGTAVLSFGGGLLGMPLDEMKTLLAQNGIKDWKLKSDEWGKKILVLRKPVRKLP